MVVAVILKKMAAVKNVEAVKMYRQKNWIKKGSVVIIATLLFSTIVSGCTTNTNGTVSEAKYISFIVGKFTSMSAAAKGMDDQVKNFSESSLSDSKWVETTKGYIGTLTADCDEIINFQKAPESFADVHSQLVTLATQGKEALTEYSEGIDTKDFDTLRSANSKIAQLADSMGGYVQTLNAKLGELQ